MRDDLDTLIPRADGSGPISLRRKLVVASLLAVALVLLFAGLAWAQQHAQFYAGSGPPPKRLSATAMLWALRVLAALMLVGGIFTIGSRNPVVSALCLVGTLFCTGVIFLLLHATFIAAIQVLVYAGAIMVLFVFVVMSVGHPEHEEIGLGRGMISKLIGIGAALMLLFRVTPIYMGPSVPKPRPHVVSNFGDVEYVGKLLFSKYLFPFEAISVLLLVAIIGAVMVTRQRKKVAAAAASSAAGGAAAAELGEAKR